ncbi:hypothetical protein LT493_35350 [Streptomyces tricolor]|nr:hypothetical protein [Streptomyces tricolor]
MSISSRCTTTVGSTIQNLSRWTPGDVTVWRVAVRLTLSEVLRAHTVFRGAVVRARRDVDGLDRAVVQGDAVAQARDPGRAGLRGERYAQTVTSPGADSRVTSYSRRGEEPPGVRLGDVTGHGVMPAPVRPMPSIRRHCPTARS